MRRTETVTIEKKTKSGEKFEIEYAKVAARLLEFLADHKKDGYEISTECEFKDGWAIMKATVKWARSQTTGHALGKVGGEKAFEKLETIAVGRALAFAGYLASGEIASLEEMQEYNRSSAVGYAEHHQLKRDWWVAFGDTFTQEELAEQFGLWAHQKSGIDPLSANDPTAWTTEQLSKCRAALDDSAAEALIESGLTNGD